MKLPKAELATVPDRFRLFLEKAVREAKTHSSWIAPNAEYERSLLSFADAILASDEFRTSFLRLQRRVAFYGFLNALAQVVLKVTSPGVPDFYQGTELWDFSLVDPDNRRPVDYEKRSSMLKTLNRATLLRDWTDGGIKMFVTARALDVRKRNAETFRRGDYRALRATSNVVAFMRGDSIVVAAPRFLTQLVKPGELPIGNVWRDETLGAGGRWRNAFTGEVIEGESLALRDVFATFPVAILERV